MGEEIYERFKNNEGSYSCSIFTVVYKGKFVIIKYFFEFPFNAIGTLFNMCFSTSFTYRIQAFWS